MREELGLSAAALTRVSCRGANGATVCRFLAGWGSCPLLLLLDRRHPIGGAHAKCDRSAAAEDAPPSLLPRSRWCHSQTCWAARWRACAATWRRGRASCASPPPSSAGGRMRRGVFPVLPSWQRSAVHARERARGGPGTAAASPPPPAGHAAMPSAAASAACAAPLPCPLPRQLAAPPGRAAPQPTVLPLPLPLPRRMLEAHPAILRLNISNKTYTAKLEYLRGLLGVRPLALAPPAAAARRPRCVLERPTHARRISRPALAGCMHCLCACALRRPPRGRPRPRAAAPLGPTRHHSPSPQSLLRPRSQHPRCRRWTMQPWLRC